jgi:anti-sigma regulatory factor (Ser/Thr protein kinase)
MKMELSPVVFAERDLWIGADVRRVREAREWAARAAREFGFPQDDCYQVKLAVSEVVANAIQHGSRTPEDPIRISIRADDAALHFEVLDTGVFRGIDEQAGELSERGRGLEVVALMMDEVELTPGRNGTVMRFSKRLELSGSGAR